MFEKAVSHNAQKLLKKLAPQEFVSPFYLAGGTSLAIQLGHRLSVDLNFFSEQIFHEKQLQNLLKEMGDLTINQMEQYTINAVLDDVKLSFMHYPYPMLKKTNSFLGVNLASVQDIACMKIDAISSRGTKWDFIDLYHICQQGHSLDSLMKLFNRKYAGIKFNRLHILKSLVYFLDAESQPMPKMFVKTSWDDVKAFFEKEAIRF